MFSWSSAGDRLNLRRSFIGNKRSICIDKCDRVSSAALIMAAMSAALCLKYSAVLRTSGSGFVSLGSLSPNWKRPSETRLERSPGGPLTHWKAPPFHGARQERTHAVQQNCKALTTYSITSSASASRFPAPAADCSRVIRVADATSPIPCLHQAFRQPPGDSPQCNCQTLQGSPSDPRRMVCHCFGRPAVPD